jgi:sensor histidine kinase regulating citrate/malate metabolism
MTLRSPIFRKFFLSAVLLTTATLLVVDFYLTRYTAQRQIEQIEQRLTAEARILSGELENIPRGQL